MFGLLLFIIVSISWKILSNKYSILSFTGTGLVAFTIYSIPAIIQKIYPFEKYTPSDYAFLESSTDLSTISIILAWITFTIILALKISQKRQFSNIEKYKNELHKTDSFVLSMIILCTAGFIWITYNDGFFFFLKDREFQSEDYVRLLWRWVNSAGLIASVISRKWKSAIIFVIGLMIHFLSGDRTIIIITFFALAVVKPKNFSIKRKSIRPLQVVVFLLLICISIYGKPIYVSAKSGNIDPLLDAFSIEWIERYIISFEPFLTFNILDLVIYHDFKLSLMDFLKSAFGQALIIPSLFGIDSNQFNVEFTSTFAPYLSYGIAGNYWAQAWSIGGPIAIVIFATIYALILKICDMKWKNTNGAVQIFFILIGAIFSIYIHRNSLDNMLSFVRQIAIVTGIGAILSRSIYPIFTKIIYKKQI